MSGFAESFKEHTGAWLLFGTLIFVGYWLHTVKRDLDEVCDLAQPATEITAPAPLDANGKPISPTDFKALLANIQKLKTEHSVDGELWRWQKFEGEKIQRLCAPSDSDERPGP